MLKLPKFLKLNIFLLTFIFLASFVFVTPTFAISKEETKYRYTIGNKGETTVEITSKITDRDPSKFVRLISLNIPQNSISSFQATLNGESLNYSILGSKVDISLPDKYVTSKEDLNLIYTYITTDIVESYGSIQNIYIPSSIEKTGEEFINEIVYDSSLGKPTFVSEFKYDFIEGASQNTIKLYGITNPNGALITLGDKQFYDISIKYPSTTSGNESVALNLPNISHNQDLYFYTEIDKGNKILRDNFHNDFLQMSPKTGIELGMQLVKLGNKSILNYEIPKSKFWKSTSVKLDFLVSSIGGQKKVSDIATYFKSKYRYVESEINTNQTLDQLIDKTELNSYEVSYLLSNILENLGYESELKAGLYMGGDNVVSLGNKLWFWNSYIENTELKELDMSLFLATDFNYITNFDLSHISFLNYSDPTVNYTFKEFKIPSAYKFSASLNPNFKIENDPNIVLELLNSSNTITSGVDSYTSLKITNSGSKVIQLDNINIDDTKVDLDKEIILYPGSSKEIQVNLKNLDWNYEGNKDIKIGVKIFGSNELTKSFEVKYVKSNLIVVFAWVLRILFSVIISTILFLLLKYILFKQFHFRFDK